MADGVLLDNDVVLKACAYRCHSETLAAMTLDGEPPAMLGIARFTLRTRLGGQNSLTDPKGATQAFEMMLAELRLLEPTKDEIALAAELEEQASVKALDFDTGESQLVAILLLRSLPLLVTGDKRAIVAISGISLGGAEGRIACQEQLIARLLRDIPHTTLRDRVCAEPRADKALTACFACSAPSVSVDDVLAGLDSYTGHLREATGPMLIADLGTVVP